MLDTWFSSGLWPFSTLGWPDDTPDLRQYYPTSLLISGYDILFFWDARMVMLAGTAPGQADAFPSASCICIRWCATRRGRRCPRCVGNVVDPLELDGKARDRCAALYAGDQGRSGNGYFAERRCVLGYRAFANKIWNAARFLFMNLEKYEAGGDTLEDLASPASRAAAPHKAGASLPLVDRWIFSRLASIVPRVNEALKEFRFHEAAHEIYHFFWGDFCDWYIEWMKPRLQCG